MNLLVIGKGGREHALAHHLGKDSKIKNVFVFPGNPGMNKTPKIKVLDHLSETEFLNAVSLLDIEFAVIGPEAEMINGFTQKLREQGISCIAPSFKAAQLETSKIFSKNLMKKNLIPTAKSYEAFSLSEANSYLEHFDSAVVLKLSGLFLGKGVAVCENLADAKKQLIEWEEYLSEGILLEEKLIGFEVSMFYLCKDTEFVFLGDATDHKRIYDGDLGPNTGGMGCFSPNPKINSELKNIIGESFVRPTLKGMMELNISFQGILFLGLMITSEGPKLLEYNVRFGDPETQTILPRLKTNLVNLFLKYIKNEKFSDFIIEYHDLVSLHIVKASKGYPVNPEINKAICFSKDFHEENANSLIYFSGVKSNSDNELMTSGGRVLGLTQLGSEFSSVKELAYQNMNLVYFEGEHFRKDIGSKI